MPPSASLHDATVVLDDRAVLRAVTIELGPGLTLIRGANGAGKTTLLRAIAGLVPLARGAREVSPAPLYLGHRPMLLRGLSARENLVFLAAFRGRRHDGVAGALRAWGLADVLDRPVERLSAGQRRRAALARLDTEPEPLVLLDEPFADLDAEAAALARDAIAAAVARGARVVVATHVPHGLEALARDAYAISGGSLARDAAPQR